MKKWRSIFISDIHLGTKGCQADAVIKFLKENDCDTLYLVGDIIDGWRIERSKTYWPKSHNEVIRTILKKSKSGCRVVYVAGNHDEFLRNWISYDLKFGNIEIVNQCTHISTDNKSYLVLHGDLFDALMHKNFKWLMHLGDRAYVFLIWFNTYFNKMRSLFGLKYWSVSNYLKQKTKKAVNFIDGFEKRLSDYAKTKAFDGVICGHIHHAQDRIVDDIHYLNSGDWVESCTAIMEPYDGKMIIMKYDN